MYFLPFCHYACEASARLLFSTFTFKNKDYLILEGM